MDQISSMSAKWGALAEPTRLRLLLVCRDRNLTVGQFADILNLPEPAVSRHLATLANVGLLTRERQGREVRYQWSSDARSSAWLSAALSPELLGDTTIASDRSRLARLGTTAALFTADSLFGQRLAAALRLLASNTSGARALVLAAAQGPVLEWLHTAAGELAVITPDTPLRHAIASFARERGITFEWADKLKPVAEFDLVCVTETSADAVERQLANAALWLAPRGRVLLGLPYDALEQSAASGGAHPLFRLRAMLSACGFSCERLLPLEAAGEHWLLACGQLAANSGAVARRG